MNKLKLILITATLTMVSHQALAKSFNEACPTILSIQKVQSGVFHAAAKSGEWSGILQGAVKDDSKIKSFSKAQVIQGSKTEPEKFENCSYNLSGQDTPLDMRLIIDTKKPVIITTTGTVWSKESSELGLTYITCEKTAPENCTFNVKIKE